MFGAEQPRSHWCRRPTQRAGSPPISVARRSCRRGLALNARTRAVAKECPESRSNRLVGGGKRVRIYAQGHGRIRVTEPAGDRSYVVALTDIS